MLRVRFEDLECIEVAYEEEDTVTLLPSAIVGRFGEKGVQFLGQLLNQIGPFRGVRACVCVCVRVCVCVYEYSSTCILARERERQRERERGERERGGERGRECLTHFTADVVV